MTIEEATGQLDILINSAVITKRIENFKEVIIHTRGIFPAKFVEALRPNQFDEEFEYIKSIYQPITQGGINKAIDSLHLILSASDFKLEGGGERINEALALVKFHAKSENLSFFDYYSNYVLRLMIEDANGGILWLPDHPTDEFKADFRFEIPDFSDTTLRIGGYPQYVNSGDIIHNEPDLLIVRGGSWIYSEEEAPRPITYRALSGVKEPVKLKQAPYYWFVDQNEIHLFIPTGQDKTGEITYSLRPYYTFKNPGIPFDILRGNFTADIDGNVIFESYFSPYIPFANESIRMFIMFQLNTNKHGFIIRELAHIPCRECKGQKVIRTFHQVDGIDELKDEYGCPTCNGTGYQTDFSPLGDINRPERRNADPNQASDRSAIEYHSAPTDISTFNKVTFYELLEYAEASINVRKQNMTNQSGESKQFDREYFEAMLKKIGDNYFRLVARGLEHWANYLDDDIPVVIKPLEYKLETAEDRANELKLLAESGVPQFIINDKIQETLNAMSANDVDQRIYRIAALNDELFGVTADQFANYSIAGFTSDDIRRSQTFIPRLRRVAAQTENFLTLPEEQILLLAEQLFTPRNQTLLSDLGADG